MFNVQVADNLQCLGCKNLLAPMLTESRQTDACESAQRLDREVCQPSEACKVNVGNTHQQFSPEGKRAVVKLLKWLLCG